MWETWLRISSISAEVREPRAMERLATSPGVRRGRCSPWTSQYVSREMDSMRSKWPPLRTVGSLAALTREGLVELDAAGGELLIEGLEIAGGAAALEQAHLASEDLDLERANGELEARADDLELVGEELLGFEEDLFADADLAEVVEQRGILQLADVVAGPGHVGVDRAAGERERAGEADGEVGDAAGVAARRRVALLDRLDAGADEALEHVLDLGVENGILERDPGLGGQRRQELFAAGVEGDDLLVHVLRCQELLAGIALLVDELEDADHLAFAGEEGAQSIDWLRYPILASKERSKP